MKRTIVAQQGEVRVYEIDTIPDGISSQPPELNEAGAAIISHSENGNHHIIDDAEVLERTDNVPKGMKIFYAIAKNSTALKQDSPNPHGKIPLDKGKTYEFRISRERNPFLDQIQRVKD